MWANNNSWSFWWSSSLCLWPKFDSVLSSLWLNRSKLHGSRSPGFLTPPETLLCYTLSFTAMRPLCCHLRMWWGKARNASARLLTWLTLLYTFSTGLWVEISSKKKKNTVKKVLLPGNKWDSLYHLSYQPHYGVNSSLFAPATTRSTSEMRSLIVWSPLTVTVAQFVFFLSPDPTCHSFFLFFCSRSLCLFYNALWQVIL